MRNSRSGLPAPLGIYRGLFPPAFSLRLAAQESRVVPPNVPFAMIYAHLTSNILVSYILIYPSIRPMPASFFKRNGGSDCCCLTLAANMCKEKQKKKMKIDPLGFKKWKKETQRRRFAYRHTRSSIGRGGRHPSLSFPWAMAVQVICPYILSPVER